MNKLIRSTLYLDKQLKSVKRKCRSMVFKLLKLKCPEQHGAIQTRIVYILMKEMFLIHMYRPSDI